MRGSRGWIYRFGTAEDKWHAGIEDELDELRARVDAVEQRMLRRGFLRKCVECQRPAVAPSDRCFYHVQAPTGKANI